MGRCMVRGYINGKVEKNTMEIMLKELKKEMEYLNI